MKDINKPNFDSDFYEDEGDPLSDFRKKYGGARIDKKGNDPFANDPDMIQSRRQEKLREDSLNIDLGGFGAY